MTTERYLNSKMFSVKSSTVNTLLLFHPKLNLLKTEKMCRLGTSLGQLLICKLLRCSRITYKLDLRYCTSSILFTQWPTEKHWIPTAKFCRHPHSMVQRVVSNIHHMEGYCLGYPMILLLRTDEAASRLLWTTRSLQSEREQSDTSRMWVWYTTF